MEDNIIVDESNDVELMLNYSMRNGKYTVCIFESCGYKSMKSEVILNHIRMDVDNNSYT